jgi:cGMP-specific 3',5'-cyclic phosphodiesterase, invertebrate
MLQSTFNRSNEMPNDICSAQIDLCHFFTLFLSHSIYNAAAYERKVKLMAKQTVALEVLSYHATAPEEEVQQIMVHTQNKTKIKTLLDQS